MSLYFIKYELVNKEKFKKGRNLKLCRTRTKRGIERLKGRVSKSVGNWQLRHTTIGKEELVKLTRVLKLFLDMFFVSIDVK